MARRKLHDQYFKQAKAEGYVARSAYKLLQIQEKKSIIKRGDRVLDLGCAPGSWLQAAEELAGPKGVIVGIDLQAVSVGFGPNVHVIQGDVTQTEPSELTDLAGGRFNVVLSDMAPNTTGAGDHFRSVALCECVLDLLPGLLKPKGNLAMKVFEGEVYPDLLKRSQKLFAECRGFKPKATRDMSTEMYIVGKGYHGQGRA